MNFTDEELRELRELREGAVNKEWMEKLTRIIARVLIEEAIEKYMKKWTVTRLSTGNVVATFDSYAAADDYAWAMGKGQHAINRPPEKSEPLTEDKREGGEDRQGLGEGR